MNTRTVTRNQIEAWGIPYECSGIDGRATELHCEQIDTRRWVSAHRLIFRAPDDSKTYAVTYERGLTEIQEDHDKFGDRTEITITEYEQRPATVMQWHPVEQPGQDSDTPTGQKYPCGLGISCDTCGTTLRGDFIVTDTMTKAERLEVVRNHVRTTQGWQCDGTGDYCPKCKPKAANPADELRQAANDLEALLTAAHGTTWRVARERNTHPEGDGAPQTIGIEPAEKCCEYDCDVIVQGEISDEDASYIAAMHPGIGHHLVQLLRSTADNHQTERDTPDCPNCGDGCSGHKPMDFCTTCDEPSPCNCITTPLAIARLINNRPR
ncbi:hypothetical protein [Streptomyces sp. NPDC057617]|uniref:hypothetical protein n=1 Tax=Streptomyces sp. NPDC057617 TaxID=3346184 RepID=UPI0036A8D628